MTYKNPHDPVETGTHYTVERLAYVYGKAQAFLACQTNRRLELNPFKPLTAKWYSYNFGARKMLLSLDGQILR